MYYIYGNTSTTVNEVNDVIAIFKNRNITVDYMFSTCIPAEGKIHCYEKQMNKEFEKKYGSAIVDEINQKVKQKRHEYLANYR